MKKIYTSVLLVTRGRKSILKETIKRLYKHAKYPKNIELFIAVDNDDIETIKFIKKNKIFKQHKNIRIFLFPRIGWKNIGLYLRELFLHSTGDIIVPLADDCFIKIDNWDETFLEYKNETVIMSSGARLAMTRKAIKKYEFVKNYLTKPHGIDPDTALWRRSQLEKIHKSVKKWYRKADVSKYAKKENKANRWELKDLKILNNLKIKELKIR